MSRRRSASISPHRAPLTSSCLPAPALQPSFDASWALFYTPSRWLDGTTEAITRPHGGPGKKEILILSILEEELINHINELKSTSAQNRLLSLSKIGEFGGNATQAIPAIVGLLENEEALLGSPAPANELPFNRMIREQSLIPKQATLTLSKIANVEVLMGLLKHQTGLVRLAAVEALGTIGFTANDAEASLAVLAASDENVHVRMAAAGALKNIQKKSVNLGSQPQQVESKKKSWKFRKK